MRISVKKNVKSPCNTLFLDTWMSLMMGWSNTTPKNWLSKFV